MGTSKKIFGQVAYTNLIDVLDEAFELPSINLVEFNGETVANFTQLTT